MELNEKDINMFKFLSKSREGIWLLDYLKRLKVALFNPQILTKDNFEETKRALLIIEEHIERRIKMANEDKKAENREYE